MNFLSQLAKGFVRSTVNQVGRDTGRVISNQIYGNAHSTPIKGVTCTDGVYYDESNNTTLSEQEFSSRLRMEGLKIQYFATHPLLKTFYFVLGLFVTIMVIELTNIYYGLIPPAVLVVVGFCKGMAAQYQMTVFYTRPMSTYTEDRRYSTGRRVSEQTLGRIKTTIMPTKSFKAKSWIICALYVLYAIMLYIAALHIMKLSPGSALAMWSIIGKCAIIVLSSLVIMDTLFKKLP
jgi:hypothetical protein